MGRIIGILLFAVVMCGLSAAGSWFVQTKVLKPATPPPNQASTASTTETPVTGATGEENASATTTGATVGSERLPVAVRPRDLSPEELLRYGMGVKQREQLVRQQEELLQQRRVQQQLALADIEGERREVDGLRIQVAGQIQSAEKLVEKLQLAKDQLILERAAAESDMKKIKEIHAEIEGQKLNNTKRLSQWLQGMDPEKAAKVLEEMANNGGMEMAVDILSFFEEREAAKILSALNDPALIQQFVEKFRDRRAPVKSAAKP